VIITFNARENHYKGKEVINWYSKLPQSEKSRKIIDILYSHILLNKHNDQEEYPEEPFSHRGDHV